METNTLPAGEYYVGDLCYVMNDQWDEVCELMFGNGSPDGVYTLKNGVKFAVHGTKHGDGTYEDQIGNLYPVDAGVIGCIRIADIDSIEADIELGNVIEFDSDFDTSCDDGVIWIGHIRINTDSDDDDDEEED